MPNIFHLLLYYNATITFSSSYKLIVFPDTPCTIPSGEQMLLYKYTYRGINTRLARNRNIIMYSLTGRKPKCLRA